MCLLFHHFQGKNHSQQAVTEALQPLKLENKGGGGSSSRLGYSLEIIGWRKLLGQPSLHGWQVSLVGRRESNTFPGGYLDRMSNMLSRVSQTPRWRVGLGWLLSGAGGAPILSIPILTFYVSRQKETQLVAGQWNQSIYSQQQEPQQASLSTLFDCDLVGKTYIYCFSFKMCWFARLT